MYLHVLDNVGKIINIAYIVEAKIIQLLAEITVSTPRNQDACILLPLQICGF